MKKRLILAITGASGIIYAKRALEVLSKNPEIELTVIISDSARMVAKTEGITLPKCGKNVFSERDMAAPCASGSNAPDAMLVMPCSMKTLAAVSCGFCDNLVSRCAEVALKEGKKLVLVVREAPLSPIALENCLKLSRIGVAILPASPGFYSRPKTISDLVDFVVGKSLDLLGVKNTLYKRWSRERQN